MSTRLNEDIAYTGPWRPAAEPKVDPLWQPGRESYGLCDFTGELLEVGVPAEAVARVIRIFERRLESEGLARAAEAMRRITACLGNTPAGWALRRALSGADGHSLERDAKSAGVEKQSLNESESRIRNRLRKLQNPS